MKKPDLVFAALLGVLMTVAFGSAVAAVSDDEPPRLTAQQRSAEKAALRRIDEGRRMLSMGQTRRARDLFNSVIKSLELNFGPNDLRIVEPLRGIARSHEIERRKLGGSVEALRRVVDVYEAHADEVSSKERVFAYVQLADLSLITKKYDQAHAVYARAWQEIADNTSPEEADGYFAEPESLWFLPTPYFPGKSPDSNPSILVSMMLDRQGRARQVTFEQVDDALDKLSRDVKRGLAKAVFRPRIVGGNVVDNDQRKLRIEYPRAGGMPTLQF